MSNASSRRRFVMDTRPLASVPYRRLFFSTIVTGVGSQLTAVAVPKQIFDITQSSSWVGASALVALVPLIVFALWGGAISDVMDRRKLLIATNTGVGVSSALLWVQAAVDNTNVAVIFVLLAVQQAAFGLNQPARSAVIPRLVSAALLPAANALNATVMALSSVIGPLLAGALIPVLGLPTLYFIDTVALGVALWAVIRLPAMPPVGDKRRAGAREVWAGFRYSRTFPILMVSFLADIIAMVFGMPRALFPELAQRTYGDPPGGGLALGLLFAAIPIGSLLAGFFSGTFTHLHRHGLAVLLAVAAWGLAIVGFGMAPTLWLAVVFLALAGAADLVSMVFRGAILLSAATEEMRGRMQGIMTVVVAGGPRVADLVHGLGGGLAGPRPTVVVGGLLVLAGTALLAWRVPSFVRYRAAAD